MENAIKKVNEIINERTALGTYKKPVLRSGAIGYGRSLDCGGHHAFQSGWN